MAGVMTLAVLLVGAGLFMGVWRFVRPPRPRGWRLIARLPLLAVCLVLAAYFVVKISYEEIYPCVAVDSMYCDFDSTQYHNLFGWEF